MAFDSNVESDPPDDLDLSYSENRYSTASGSYPAYAYPDSDSSSEDEQYGNAEPSPEYAGYGAEYAEKPKNNADDNQPGIRPQHSIVRDIAEIVLLIVTIYTLVNLATARAVVEGQSMQPNFYTGQLVIVNRFAYYFSSPQRGDVVVLHDPKDVTQDFIKRVVGLPNETIQIKEGRVYANGFKLEEPYIDHFCTAGCDGTWNLTPNEYFVLGDNRTNSFDSHSFGPLERNLIVGQAWIRYWPPKDMGMIEHPRYSNIPADK